MKKKKSPRLIALAMALVMLLPMMTGIPVFAAEVMAQSTTPTYFEDFTNVTDGKDLYYVGSTGLPSSDLIVNDPTNSGKGKVWQMNVADHVDLGKNPSKELLDWFWITENTWSTKFVYEFDFYVEKGAVGLIGMDSQVLNDGTNDASGYVWQGIYGLDLTNGQILACAKNSGSTVTSVTNDASFEQGKWYTLSLAMDIETCAYSLYLDGYKLMDAQMPVQNLWGNILYQKANTGSSGTVYIDNMSVYAGTLPRNVKTDTRFLPIVSESQDYEADGATVIGQNASIKDVNGNKVAYLPHAYNNSIFGAQSNAYNYNQSSGVVVLRADYYIDASAEEQIGICSQIMTADGTTANGQTTTHWNALWNLWRAPDEDVRYKPGHARLLIGGRDVKAYTFDGDANTQIYVPCNKWVNITCVLDMIHAKLTVYVDGVAHATSTFGSTFTGNISFSENMWIAAKYSSSEGETFCYVDNTAIFDGSDTDIAQEKQLELDEDKSLLYIDATVGNKSYRTLSPKYFVLAGETFSATPVYFNENGEYDSVVSMLHKVSIRYGNGTPENPAGMRFATQLDTDLLAELQDMVAAGIISRINGFTYVKTAFDPYSETVTVLEEKPFSKGPRADVKCYGSDNVPEGVAIMKLENVGVSITGNSTNPTRFQHPVAGTYKKWCQENGVGYFSVASGGGTGRTLHPDNMAAGPSSYGMTDTMGRMHSDAQFAGSSSVPAHVEMMGLIGAGNNPMVGMTVAVAVAIEEASK